MFDSYLYSLRALIDYYKSINDDKIEERTYYANCALMHLRNFLQLSYYDNMVDANKYYAAFKKCVEKVVV